MGGLLPHFFAFNFFHTSTYPPQKTYRKCYAFFFYFFSSGKTGQKFAREVLKLAFQKCGRRPPIVLLVEIHKPKNFNLNFSRSFLQIIVEIGEK